MKSFTIFDKARGVFDHRFSKKLRNRVIYESVVREKNGLEIGGPSRIFTSKGNLPLYHLAKNIDGCNYSASTVWNEEMKSGDGNYLYGDRRRGHQYIHEATHLTQIETAAYDFLLASHCLEHCANPVKALNEWMRVVRNDGHLIVVLPHKEGTFDHRRPVTALEHMVDDFKRDVGEDDLTALEEVLRLHDFSQDKGPATVDALRERSLKNLENRCLHHHVFNGCSSAHLMDYAGLKILDVQIRRPYHIVFLLQRVTSRPENGPFLEEALYRSISPFGN